MEAKEKNDIFDKDTALSYDSQRDKLSPIKDALHLAMQMLLCKLPKNAKILCVGAGTGSELIYLAQVFPQWTFTIVEPALKMLEICSQRVKEFGFLSRCTFHQGYLDSLPDMGLYDGATSILVSHFIVNRNERSKYFSEIASRLSPEAYMINADMSSDMSSVEYQNLLEGWINMHDYANMPVRIESFGSKVAMVSTEEIKSIIKESGFEEPTLFFQTLFIHAWFSKVK